MERFPGQLVIGGAIMVAGGAVAYGLSDAERDGVSIIVLGMGIVVTVMGILIGYFALKGAAEAREGKR